ncbi:hypothetical protein AMELA_G00252840 [Ameiurus melas]|uniref:Interleukin-7 n=1 Tax=Ameiurus melas TaxID=219545 RepID=A0A7J5ZQN3_AMEME|nr:hypothetical protein AMELA_G00252840 [Ameiurus melas]
MLKMQKSRFAVFCLICALLFMKSGMCDRMECLKNLQRTAHNIIKHHVEKLSMKCHHLTEDKVQFSNRTNCIVRWMTVNCTSSEESDEIIKLKNISALLKSSMHEECSNTTWNQHTTYIRNKCLSKFLKCWCGFLEMNI